jgi:uncharacterized membrane protein YeaQ/YmgE (transglycosylase-associated protein family)
LSACPLNADAGDSPRLVWTLIIGLLAGIITKFLHPSFILTTLLGLAGAFLAIYFGQTIGWYRADEGAGLIRAVVGGIVVIWGSLADAQAAGLIDNQIRAAIRAARFVVADLTHDSNGAYFESGFGEGLGLPVIYTCESARFAEKKTHFDTNHMLTAPWNLADLAATRRQLAATVRNTLPAEAESVTPEPAPFLLNPRSMRRPMLWRSRNAHVRRKLAPPGFIQPSRSTLCKKSLRETLARVTPARLVDEK